MEIQVSFGRIHFSGLGFAAAAGIRFEIHLQMDRSTMGI